ncbi:MAG: hypothetical protein ACKVQT_10560 [Burkholderiales bacterium]
MTDRPGMLSTLDFPAEASGIVDGRRNSVSMALAIGQVRIESNTMLGIHVN